MGVHDIGGGFIYGPDFNDLHKTLFFANPTRIDQQDIGHGAAGKQHFAASGAAKSLAMLIVRDSRTDFLQLSIDLDRIRLHNDEAHISCTRYRLTALAMTVVHA